MGGNPEVQGTGCGGVDFQGAGVVRGEGEGKGVGYLSATRNTVRWYSAKQIASFSNAVWWHWTHSAVLPSSWVKNCSSTTALMVPLVSCSSFFNHHQQALWSCWANAKGQHAESLIVLLWVWPTCCKMAHFTSGYSSILAVDSCCAASWASPHKSSSNQATCCSSSHPHTSVAHSNSSKKVCGSS